MTDSCHGIEDFGELAELADGDPRLAHLDACASCRSQMAAYRRFAAGIPDSSDPARETELAAWLRKEVIGVEVPVRRPGRFVLTRLATAGLATAAIFLLFLSYQEYRSAALPEAGTATRGEASAGSASGLRLESTSLAGGGQLLSWGTGTGREHYRVIIYSTDLHEIARFEVASTASLELTGEQLAELRPGNGPLLWRVQVVEEGEILTTSSPGTIASPR